MSYLDDTSKGMRQEAGGILFYCFTAWLKRRQHCIAALVEEAAAYDKIHLFRCFIWMNSAGAKLLEYLVRLSASWRHPHFSGAKDHGRRVIKILYLFTLTFTSLIYRSSKKWKLVIIGRIQKQIIINQ